MTDEFENLYQENEQEIVNEINDNHYDSIYGMEGISEAIGDAAMDDDTYDGSDSDYDDDDDEDDSEDPNNTGIYSADDDNPFDDEVIPEDYSVVVLGEAGELPADETSEFSDEEVDAVADTAIAVLQDILKYFEIGEVTIDEYEGDEGELILDITGSDLAVLIGRHGRTLDALQFLISSILFRKLGFRYPVVIDVEGYKSRQRQKIENIAYSAAERAIEQDRRIKLRPMSPYERRIVHLYLRNDDRVETKSEGEGHARRVVIIPR